MANEIVSNPAMTERSGADVHSQNVLWDAAKTVLRPLASLKLTVALLAMGIFIVLVGTLAQVDMDMWEVMNKYFRAWIAMIPVGVFFPRTWFPNFQPKGFSFPFPGGAAIGLAMVLNLLSAHLVRFQSNARGMRLIVGAVVTWVGVILTWMVIASGHNAGGLQAMPLLSWETMWDLVRVVLFCGAVGSIGWFGFLLVTARQRVAELILVGTTALFLVIPSIVVIWWGEDAYLGDSGMRILWQLIKATFAGLVLLAGCSLLFAKRAGVVLLHGGIGLMMFGQFFVSQYDVEEQITMREGETVNFAQDIRAVELAVVDRENPRFPDENFVVAIPVWQQGAETPFLKNKVVKYDALPFDVEFVKYWRNADLKAKDGDQKSPATAGKGANFVVIEDRHGSGADMDSKVDLATALVKFTDKKTNEELGTYLISQLAFAMRDGNEFNFEDEVKVGDKTYDVALRFQRNYKDYSMRLIDVRKDDYLGTNTPRNYSSDIQLVDNKRNVDREIKIWMNNPLRYAGETFYQSGYNKDMQGNELTTLQVVRNTGWMIPYVACMLVTVGMGAHFLNTLLRFLRRQVSAPEQSVVWGRLGDSSFAKVGGIVFTVLVVLVFAGYFASKVRMPKAKEGAMDLQAFAALPVIADGRVKPFDTLARNSLRVISGREEFKDSDGNKQPAIRWLLDVIGTESAAHGHRVFRIDNPEIQDLLALERRQDHLYSVDDLFPKINEFEKQVSKLREENKKTEQMSVFERQLLSVDTRLRTFTKLRAAFRPPSLPDLPDAKEFDSNREQAIKKIEVFRRELSRFVQSLEQAQVPLAVPYKNEDKKKSAEFEWQPYSKAWTLAYVDSAMLGRAPDKSLMAVYDMFGHYSDGKVAEFNASVKSYQELLSRLKPEELKTKDSFISRMVSNRFGSFYGFEAFFNHAAPFYYADVFYVVAFVLTAISWLGLRNVFNRAAFWLILMTLGIHTLALGARIFISGRPPVTNLYSSAVFISWGCVVLGLMLEITFRLTIGNAIAAVTGFAGLFIAHNLAADGDTFTVLQAVLDTQFWLATHVVCISMGYLATFVAGALGIGFVLQGVATPTLNQDFRKVYGRMIYGTLCFATFLSFVGTVLGGLWADDSWGRFWGWDPKENGALIIVLWNALALHAKWDNQIKDRGLAVLAIGGNIVTAWSWFGVNELSVGLHAYGFTEGRLMYLGLFFLSQLILIGIGMIPFRDWWSSKDKKASEFPAAV